MFHLLSDLFERLLKRFLSRYKRTRSSYRKIQITLRPSIRRKHSTEEKLFWNEIYRSLRTFSHDWPHNRRFCSIYARRNASIQCRTPSNDAPIWRRDRCRKTSSRTTSSRTTSSTSELSIPILEEQIGIIRWIKWK